MGWRQVDGSLGPVREHNMPVVPSRWRVPALIATLLVCVGIFVAAVLIGIHG
jgi:hypothetical protein